MATIIRPPLITKIEPLSRHAAIDSSPQQSRLNNLLKGKDTFFDGAGRAPVYDWPNPVGWDMRSRAWPSVLLRTWTDSYKLTLIGKDVLPRDKYDWPNPIGYDPKSRAQPSVLLKTWTDSYKLTLIGKDVLPTRSTDRPNPRGPLSPIDLRTWTDRRVGMLGKDQLTKFSTEWPNPRGPVPAIDLKTWVWDTTYLIGSDQFFGLAGHPNFDWPNPRGPIPVIDLKTWLETTVYLLGKDQLPTLNRDWPNPRGARFPTLTPDQINLLNTLLAALRPFNTTNWPNPVLAGRGLIPTVPNNPNLPTPPVTADQLRQIIRFAPIAFGGRTHWTR